MRQKLCAYCHDAWGGPGWHDCLQAQSAKAEIEDRIAAMKRIADRSTGVTLPETSEQIRLRANRRRSYATSELLLGHGVQPGYEPLSRSELFGAYGDPDAYYIPVDEGVDEIGYLDNGN